MGWAAGAPPLLRSAAAPQAAALGLSILAAAPHGVGVGGRHWERRRRHCSSRAAGQRRRAPPAGRKGASAPPGPAVRDPRLKRRRRSRCPDPGPVPARRGRSRTFPAQSVPDAPPREAIRAPGRPLGVSSASPDSPAQAIRHSGAGACARRGHLPRPPAGRGRGRLPPSASPVCPPPSVSPVRLPRPVAWRELPGDRGSGCCPPARPLACRQPLLSLPLGPCPAVYMPVKPPATLSPSEPQLPEGEASRPANWTGHSDLGPPISDPRLLCRIRHHLGGIRLWCFEEGVWCRERNPGDFWLPFFGPSGLQTQGTRSWLS